uniref:Uncharacterized protein n=1 Tax=Triticum urartu TaxID=4572 RepID=A0A8R7V753_TRIUA
MAFRLLLGSPVCERVSVLVSCLGGYLRIYSNESTPRHAVLACTQMKIHRRMQCTYALERKYADHACNPLKIRRRMQCTRAIH